MSVSPNGLTPRFSGLGEVVDEKGGQKGAVPQPMVERFECLQYSARIREHVVAEMRECEVAHAEGGKLAQRAERIAKVVCSAFRVRIKRRSENERDDPSSPKSAAILPRCTALVTSRGFSAIWNVWDSISGQRNIRLQKRDGTHVRVLVD
jgi:hypothetical protein